MEVAYLAVMFLAVALGRRELEPILWGLLAGFIVYMRTKPESRHIPAAVRRKKEAEFVLKMGKKFDRKKYELDHEVPWASGGGHHESNIRVVEKKKNRSKGAKSPWWDLLGGWAWMTARHNLFISLFVIAASLPACSSGLTVTPDQRN